jgi:hypothetical protein
VGEEMQEELNMSESLKTKVMDDLAKREDSLNQIRVILEKIGELSYDTQKIFESMFDHVDYFKKYNHKSCWLKCVNGIEDIKIDINCAKLDLYEIIKSESQQIQQLKEIWEKEKS